MSQSLAKKSTRQYVAKEGLGIKTHVITIDESYYPEIGYYRRSAGCFSLTDPELFPHLPEIDPMEKRQEWKRFDKVMINWPRKRGEINITQTEVYGLYENKKQADAVCHELEAKFKEDSLQAHQNAVAEMDSGNLDENGICQDSDGVADSPRHVPSLMSGPTTKRQKKSNNVFSAANTSAPSGFQANIQLVALLHKQHEEVVEKLDILISHCKESESRDESFSTVMAKVATNVKSNSRKSHEMLTLLEGKPKHIAALCTDQLEKLFLYDPEKEPLLYMGVDITEEINRIFHDVGGDRVKFVKAVACWMYGDDLWFWMISKVESSRPGKRRSLQKRDLEGYTLLKNIFRRFFDECVWSEDKESSASTEGKSSSQVAKDEHRKRCAWKSFKIQAESWFNDWGNDTRGRKAEYPWTKSLFGRMVLRDDTEKPKNYNADEEQTWRETSLAAKIAPKKRGYELPPA